MSDINQTIESIGSKIKYYRNLNNISLSKLAKEANISKSTLFGLEEGKANPTISTLMNIAATLKIDLNELIDSSSYTQKIASNISLVNYDSKNKKYIYKLQLNNNETTTLNFSNCIDFNISVTNGSIYVINQERILNENETIKLKNFSTLKSLDKNSTAIISYQERANNLCFNSDIFLSKIDENSFEKAKLLAKRVNIIRLISPSLYPLKYPKKSKNINIVEIIENGELNFYIYKTLKYFIENIKKLGFNELKENLSLIEDISQKEFLEKELFYLNPIFHLESKLIELLKSKFNNATLINSFDLNELNNSKEYYIFLEDFIENNTQNLENLKLLTLKIKLFRALEYMLPFKEEELNEDELSIYNTIRKTLPKIFYYSNENRYNLAIFTLKEFLSEFNLKDIQESIYKDIIINLYQLLDGLENFEFLNTKDNFLNTINSYNLEVVLESKISESIDSNYKYLFICKKR